MKKNDINSTNKDLREMSRKPVKQIKIWLECDRINGIEIFI